MILSDGFEARMCVQDNNFNIVIYYNLFIDGSKNVFFFP